MRAFDTVAGMIGAVALFVGGLWLCSKAGNATMRGLKSWRGEMTASRTTEYAGFAVMAAAFVAMLFLFDALIGDGG